MTAYDAYDKRRGAARSAIARWQKRYLITEGHPAIQARLLINDITHDNYDKHGHTMMTANTKGTERTEHIRG